MKRVREIEKELIRMTLEWDNLKGRVEIKKGPFRGFAIYYNNTYVACVLRLDEIHSILCVIDNMVRAMR